MEELILVDAADEPLGFEEKFAAHRDGGRLHRAFSIFIFNRSGEMLLQQRAAGKYHFGGVWSNACCGHPRRGERLEDATHRRLREELGFDAELGRAFSFTYTAWDEATDMTERELDHVFAGAFDGVPRPDAGEIADLRWVDCGELLRSVETSPELFAPWFVIALARLDEIRLAARPSA